MFLAAQREDGGDEILQLVRSRSCMGTKGQLALDIQIGGRSALHAAAEAGHVNPVIALIECGANPRAQAVYGGATPLHCASEAGHFEVCKALVRMNLRGQTCCLCLKIKIDIVSTLYFR